MKLYLIVAKGPREGLPIAIDVDLFLLGSEKMCQLRAPNLGAKQCALVTRHAKVFIRDFDSGAPTLVNGDLVPPGSERPLHDGDRLEVGHLEFFVHFQHDSTADSDLEEWAATCLDVQAGRSLHDVEDDAGFAQSGTAADAAAKIIGRMNALKGQVMGRLRVHREHGVVSIRFNDADLVDASEVAHVKKELTENLDRANVKVLLDLKNVRRMSTGAITMIAEVGRWIKPRGGSMAMCRIHPELRAMISKMKLADIPMFDDKPTALSSRW